MKKTILIIGSAGGLSTTILDKFNTDEFNLALNYFSNIPQINQSKSIKYYKADITIESDVESMVSKVIADFGSVDILINNAGVSISEMSWKSDIENWNKTIGANLTGPYLVSKHVLPIMRKNGWGRVVFVSSIVAQQGFVGTSSYAASKAGLFGLMKTIAKEVASKGITVNTIALGYFSAGMINDVPKDLKLEIIDSIPQKKLGNPIEFFETLRYLISENTSYLTGQTINLNGGLYM